MPSEVVCDITLKWLAAILGKGALGKWRALSRPSVRTLGRVAEVPQMSAEPGI